MSKKQFFTALFSTSFLLLVACNSGGNKDAAKTDSDNSAATAESHDPKGIGPYKNVELTHPLDEKMVATGQNIYNVKCQSCHKLTGEKLVGPGWKGVTDRRQPEWIMNFVTNVDEMIEKDTAAQRMLEVCLVKMPNQNLAEADARSVLEFMRKNDGKQ
jgi:mono/diheme cytochrome c family protein